MANDLQRSIPKTISEANKSFHKRKTGLIKSFIRNFAFENGFNPWDNDGKYALRKMAAGLAVFAHPQRYTKQDMSLLSGLALQKPYADHLKSFQSTLLTYLKSVHIFETVGTDLGSTVEKKAPDGKHGGDYDFLLKETIPVLHLFATRPDILTKDMAWLLLSQGAGEHKPIPYTGSTLDYRCVSGKDYQSIPGLRLKLNLPETENHLLMIYGWKFLVNNYVKWMASLPPSHPRFDVRVKNLYNKDPARYNNSSRLTNYILQLLGRVVHNGLFETNAKAYESFSVSAIMNFHSFADKFFPENSDCKRVKNAAQNALDYLATNFAFQSFEGKRTAPMRRNWDYHRSIGNYENDYMPFIFGILSGAYAFSDYNGSDIYPDKGKFHKNEKCPFFFSNLGQAAGFALWSALLDYRIPDVVHGFMLNKYNGYWARMHTKFTDEHYPMAFKYSTFFRTPSDPPKQFPQYFKNGKPFTTGSFKPVGQLYFATPKYLNACGGNGNEYANYRKWGFSLGWFTGTVKAYNAQSRPSMLLFKGDNGYWKKDISLAEKETITMRGDPEYFWESQNLTAYKNFCCGYDVNEKKSMHLKWPQRYPASWDRFIEQNFSINRAVFRIFNFDGSAVHPLSGHYLILARVGKNHRDDEFRHFARGWWEVVPDHMFPDSEALMKHIKHANPPQHFSNHKSAHYKYALAATGEIIQFNCRFGARKGNGIMRLWSKDGAVMPLNTYIFNQNNTPKLRELPLISVWQTDKNYGFTGYIYAESNESGLIRIRNPHIKIEQPEMVIDSRDFTRPSNNNPVRSCPL